MLEHIALSTEQIEETRKLALFDQITGLEREYVQLEVAVATCVAQDVKQSTVADRLAELQRGKEQIEKLHASLVDQYKMLQSKSNGLAH